MTETEEEFVPTDRVKLRRRFPWLLMLDAARVAIDPRKLLLAAAGIVVLWLLNAGLDLLPFAAERPAPPVTVETVIANAEVVSPDELTALGYGPDTIKRVTDARRLVDAPNPVPASGLRYVNDWSATRLFLRPLLDTTSSVVRPVADVNQPIVSLTGPRSSWSRVADAVLRVLAALFVWALFGGAIARIAALRLTDDHPASLVGSLKYSARYLLSSVGGPLTPLVGVLLLWGGVALLGLVARIPAVGPIIAGVLWIPALLLGVLAAILLVGTLLAWPLMVATLSVEGTDAFDALSRGLGYLFGRPLYTLMLAVLMLLAGTLGAWVVREFADLATRLTMRFFSTGAGTATLDVATDVADQSQPLLWWSQTVFDVIAAAYPAAFFWTAVTAGYLLLRQSFEATPLDVVWIAPTDEKDDMLPLVGEPAAECREEELAEKTED